MTYYETLYIVHPALESGRLKDIILSIDNNIKNIGGDIISIDLWGKKKLAYLIDKEKYGTYVKIQFSGKNDCAQKLGIELEHNSNILSHLTISIKENDLVKQENDLDTQIAGQSREAQRIDSRLEATDKKNSPENKQPSENDKIHSAVITESEEEPVEKSVETSGEEDPVMVNDENYSSDPSKAKETDASEIITESVKENQKNVDETSTITEKE